MDGSRLVEMRFEIADFIVQNHLYAKICNSSTPFDELVGAALIEKRIEGNDKVLVWEVRCGVNNLLLIDKLGWKLKEYFSNNKILFCWGWKPEMHDADRFYSFG